MQDFLVASVFLGMLFIPCFVTLLNLGSRKQEHSVPLPHRAASTRR